jgi:hypothetical protein
MNQPKDYHESLNEALGSESFYEYASDNENPDWDRMPQSRNFDLGTSDRNITPPENQPEIPPENLEITNQNIRGRHYIKAIVEMLNNLDASDISQVYRFSKEIHQRPKS